MSEEKNRRLRKEVSNRLKDLRRLWKYGLPQMAEQLGITVNAYRKNEHGDTLPNWESQLRLLNKGNVSMDWLLYGKGPMHFDQKKKAADVIKEATEPLEKQVNELKTKITALEKEATEQREKLTGLENELETTTIQKDKAEKELEEIKSKLEKNPIPEMAPELVEMVNQMNQIPLLRYELLAQFHRFLEEKR